MNNKKLGTDFEREFCEKLKKKGYWVHFIETKADGSQPFDVIAAANGMTYVFDCKTSATKNFSIKRLQDNQILAFERWIECGNNMPRIAIKYNGNIYLIPYYTLKYSSGGRINLEDYDEVYRWK